ncbi:Dfp1/Him1, central region-domain-containing protein [Triangularia setosa]|uniref:Dfp1/Him1, central region-domain-containing protein n=1 Tax=Triangularia setosa TaxID=2587417 RepID=A0AAN7AAV1_9PEZI|nr:Dfp1/Him1, central region-domain-containing protein [Podospora setosa]
MAAVSLSPAPPQLSAMSTVRRAPLSNNPNVANSPMRASAALNGAKKVRSHAELLREEPYGQPPPAKRQMIERGVASPGRTRSSRTIVHRAATTRAAVTTSQKTSHGAVEKASQLELAEWRATYSARFPTWVFYFESVPDEQRSRLAKRVTNLGAREEKFFSIDVTHVITTRTIPRAEKTLTHVHETGADAHGSEQPKTIDPSLLNRVAEAPPVRRKLVFDTSRRMPVPGQDAKPQKSRSTDILLRAQDMKMKLWSVDKLTRFLEALEAEPHKGTSHGRTGTNKTTDRSNLRQLLQQERVHGPSDRDPTVATKEMHHFKGPYIYIYDMEEKTKPVMAREYPKVADKKDGEWPQFRVASAGRCPFVEDYEVPEKENREKTRVKERVAKAAAVENAVKVQPPEVPAPKPATGKRTLAVMEDGQNRGTPPVNTADSFDRSRVSNPPQMEFRTQNAFMSHAKAGRLLAGEPVASGLQQSAITSAIRSQMISSTSGVLGAKAGTSKEIHGLQRKVLAKAGVPAVSQDLSSRRMAEMSHDSTTFVRSASASRATHRKLETVDEEEAAKQRETLRRTVSMPVTQRQKRDPKPGYCENCMDKFDDFDEHILTRKHRKFAENDDNWVQLDALLSLLKRRPRHRHEVDDAEW